MILKLLLLKICTSNKWITLQFLAMQDKTGHTLEPIQKFTYEIYSIYTPYVT